MILHHVNVILEYTFIHVITTLKSRVCESDGSSVFLTLSTLKR